MESTEIPQVVQVVDIDGITQLSEKVDLLTEKVDQLMTPLNDIINSLGDFISRFDGISSFLLRLNEHADIFLAIFVTTVICVVFYIYLHYFTKF